MNAVGRRYFPRLVQVWRDERCTSPVEGAILACATAIAVMLAAAGLRGELHQMLDLVSNACRSLLS